MSTIKQLKRRINAVQSAQKITQTMHMISSMQLVKLKNKLNYAINTKESLEKLISSTFVVDDAQGDTKKKKKSLYVVFSTEKGLCGGYNSRMIKFFAQHITKEKKEEKYILCIGKKISNIIKEKYTKITQDQLRFNSKNYTALALHILSFANNHEVDTIKICYHKFFSMLNNAPEIMEIRLKKQLYLKDEIATIDDIEVSDRIYKKSILYALYFCIISSKISEESSRVFAMNNATQNCSDVLDKLVLVMNKTRQSNITKELIEIVSSSQVISNN